MWKQGLNILLYVILKSLPLSKPSLCYCWMLPWSLVVEEAKRKEQAAKWSLNIKWNLLHTVDGGHARLPNRVLLYQHLYVWEILSLVKTGEKKEWLSFSPPAVFYCKYPDFQNIFFSQSSSNSVEVIEKRGICFLTDWHGWLKYCKFTASLKQNCGGNPCQIVIRLGLSTALKQFPSFFHFSFF